MLYFIAATISAAGWPKNKPEPCTADSPESKSCAALDRYLLTVAADAPRFVSGATPGSLYTPGGRMTELGRDIRAAWQYNNLCYNVAGLLIERLSGRSFEAFIRARLTDRLGMTVGFSLDDLEAWMTRRGHT